MRTQRVSWPSPVMLGGQYTLKRQIVKANSPPLQINRFPGSTLLRAYRRFLALRLALRSSPKSSGPAGVSPVTVMRQLYMSIGVTAFSQTFPTGSHQTAGELFPADYLETPGTNPCAFVFMR